MTWSSRFRRFPGSVGEVGGNTHTQEKKRQTGLRKSGFDLLALFVVGLGEKRI